MKKSEAILLYTGLNNCGNLIGQKFGYAISRNLQILKPEFDKVEAERIALIDNYAKKKDGKFVMEDFINDKGMPDKRYTFEDIAIFEAEYQKLLNEELELKLFYIKLDEVPNEINATQINGIYKIIVE